MRFSRPILLFLVFVGAVTAVSAAIIILKNDGRQEANIGQSSSGSAKISIGNSGIYGVSIADLRQVGIEIDDFSFPEVGLSTSGIEVPYTILDDTLIFYGAAPDDRYTASRSYRLEIGSPGVQMANSQNSRLEDPQIEWITRTLHIEENNIYDSRAIEGYNSDGNFTEPFALLPHVVGFLAGYTFFALVVLALAPLLGSEPLQFKTILHDLTNDQPFLIYLNVFGWIKKTIKNPVRQSIKFIVYIRCKILIILQVVTVTFPETPFYISPFF